MATKDWKKSKSPEDLYYWYSEYNDSGITINRSGKKYIVGFESSRIGDSYTKSFKTKSQALAYARSYMRSH